MTKPNGNEMKFLKSLGSKFSSFFPIFVFVREAHMKYDDPPPAGTDVEILHSFFPHSLSSSLSSSSSSLIAAAFALIRCRQSWCSKVTFQTFFSFFFFLGVSELRCQIRFTHLHGDMPESSRRSTEKKKLRNIRASMKLNHGLFSAIRLIIHLNFLLLFFCSFERMVKAMDQYMHVSKNLLQSCC